VLWVLWLTYGSFYFCRSNLAAAVPGIRSELVLTRTEIGWILGALKLAYGIGQLINGQLAERVAPRRLLAIGMLASAALNVVFGFGTGLYFLIFVWACNGYAQALGWAPTMRVATATFSPERRGRAIAVIGTGYQLAGALTFVVAGASVDAFGWRGAVWVPAILLALSAIHMLVLMPREAPPRVAHARSDAPWTRTLAATLGNGRLWLLAGALGLLSVCRYGFIDWGIAHLIEAQPASVTVSALKYAVLPLGGIAGTLAAGWATDRYFGGRRAPVVCVMLVGLAGLVLGYDALVQTSLIGSIIALALIGALIFGPQVLLVGAAPVDLAHGGTVAAAVGFVDFIGYVGASIGDQVTGFVVDRYDWHVALELWAGAALAGALVVAPLWRTRAAAP
jgi:sugar phosphate permease